MTGWFGVALLGGVVGLDATAFPQVMISRPLIAAALTGALFGRPMEGLVLGFMLEVFSLAILPIGAARYPESGTAAVAATGAYMAAVPAGLEPSSLALALAFGLAWEHLAGETVVLQRRSNGRMLTGGGAIAARQLERRHLVAMSVDLVRGAVVSVGGALLGYGLLRLVAPLWDLGEGATLAVLGVLVAAMLGTSIPLFGGFRARKAPVIAGIATGIVLAVVLS